MWCRPSSKSVSDKLPTQAVNGSEMPEANMSVKRYGPEPGASALPHCESCRGQRLALRSRPGSDGKRRAGHRQYHGAGSAGDSQSFFCVDRSRLRAGTCGPVRSVATRPAGFWRLQRGLSRVRRTSTPHAHALSPAWLSIAKWRSSASRTRTPRIEVNSMQLTLPALNA